MQLSSYMKIVQEKVVAWRSLTLQSQMTLGLELNVTMSRMAVFLAKRVTENDHYHKGLTPLCHIMKAQKDEMGKHANALVMLCCQFCESRELALSMHRVRLSVPKTAVASQATDLDVSELKLQTLTCLVL